MIFKLSSTQLRFVEDWLGLLLLEHYRMNHLKVRHV